MSEDQYATDELYVLVTRYVNPVGKVITHAYGSWPRRDLADRRRKELKVSHPQVEATTCKVLMW